jgi:hypothetical protein
VELPDDGRAQDELWFSNILCGVLRGALEMVSRSQQAGICMNVSSSSGWISDVPLRFKCKSRPTLSVMF